MSSSDLGAKLGELIRQSTRLGSLLASIDKNIEAIAAVAKMLVTQDKVRRTPAAEAVGRMLVSTLLFYFGVLVLLFLLVCFFPSLFFAMNNSIVYFSVLKAETEKTSKKEKDDEDEVGAPAEAAANLLRQYSNLSLSAQVKSNTAEKANKAKAGGAQPGSGKKRSRAPDQPEEAPEDSNNKRPRQKRLVDDDDEEEQ